MLSQLGVTRDFIAGHLDREVSLLQMAGDCGLSVSHFAKAFARSMGVPPHRWLMDRRVDRAKDLMRTTDDPLAEIALKCGFSEQSHFNRVFLRFTGATPARWRERGRPSSVREI